MTKLINSGDPALGQIPEAPVDADRIVADYFATRDGAAAAVTAPTRPHKHRPMSPHEVDGVLARPFWHDFATPEEVIEAREALLASGEACHESARAVGSLKADERAEGDRYAIAVATAVEAGEEPPALVRADWEAEATKREAVDRVRQQQLREARRRYEEAVEEALPAWRARLTEEVERLRGQAREALAAASAPVRQYLSAASALDAMSPRPDFLPEDFLTEARQEIERADPRLLGGPWEHIRASQLAQEAKEAHARRALRPGNARHALDTLAELLA